jgi:predicted ferric reductase
VTMNVFIILGGVVVPSLLIVLGAGNSNTQSVLALCAGASAFSLMAINLFLATRPRFVEPAFGGLDRLYKAHKWIGISLLPLLLFHKFVGMDLDGRIVASGLAKTAVDIAKIAFLILMPLILLSWLKRLPKMRRDLLPYNIWRIGHRVMGLVFIALALHQLFVRVPFDGNSMPAQYLNLMAIIGIASFLYTQFLAPFRPRSFVVSNVEAHPAATIIDAVPKRRGFARLQPGGFGVISFAKKGLRESHPFTISRIGDDGSLQFSIRALGDYTGRVRAGVAVGDRMTIEAGYGGFDYRRGEDSQVWLAGGIGITPFLTFADSLMENNKRNITLVYCVGKAEEAVGLDRLHAAQARTDGFKLHLHVSEDAGRMDVKKLVAIVPYEMTNAGFWFCGPAPMREAMIKDLKAMAKAPRSVHFERFEFR